MNSVNPYYTFHYSQPTEYRFSHDSVFLARRIYNLDIPASRILDLCAGCGIVGLDYLFHLRSAGRPLPSQIDFLEVQSVYEQHFLENCRRLGPVATRLDFILQNYADFTGAYDLILCNPPYFTSGQLSPSEFKNRCRFFIDSDFEKLQECIRRCLAPGGNAFVLSRQAIPGWQPLPDIRGTGLYQFTQA